MFRLFITSTASDSGFIHYCFYHFFMVRLASGGPFTEEKTFQLRSGKNLRNIMVWIVRFGSSTSCILGLYQRR